MKTAKSITRVIFNGPATIVFWNDNTKTVVKCSKLDTYDEEKGLAMAICKKLLGVRKYNRYFKTPDGDPSVIVDYMDSADTDGDQKARDIWMYEAIRQGLIDAIADAEWEKHTFDF